MAITLSDGFVPVADKAIDNLNSVKESRNELHGANEPLEGIMAEADRLIDILNLAQGVQDIQSDAVNRQAFVIMELASRLTVLMMTMGAENRRALEPRVFQPADAEYRHLEGMLRQLESAHTKLSDLIRQRLDEGGIETVHIVGADLRRLL
ncbi:hypothetical protein QBC34DRAFT_401680 [Podospora aff. communis PSN243]|uniref:NACHT-NTPase and P-loop NTPases N-terminal domain-containing protein n=1 Tax=Podospora aff. communis PSN243 TaxID=3040156 RepID=A0AAV9GUA0_9PEZI|nr:hypothetical protein QBC34DRAFT_401680 [Podospora aff. communis PSN243]